MSLFSLPADMHRRWAGGTFLNLGPPIKRKSLRRRTEMEPVVAVMLLVISSVIGDASRGDGGGENPPEKVVNPGESLSIPCFLETPGGSVQWMRNGHPVVLDVGVTGGRRQWNISRDGTAALTISAVTRADDGLWECREFGDDDTVRRVTKVLKLVVTGAPEEPFLTVSGERLQEGSRVTVQEREELEVCCVARRAVPAVRHIHWLLGEANMTAASHLFVEFSPQEDSYSTKSILTLNVSRDLHGVELSCHVYHVSWPTPAVVSTSLDVHYVPSFAISREPGFGFPILEKMAVSLHCAVDANPPCRPQWLKDDASPPVPQSPDGYLNFTAIERHHAGWYRCAAVHELGTFASFGYFLNVRYGPEIVEQPPSHVEAVFGEQVQLDCKAEGKPPPSYCWTRVRSGRLESLAAEKSLLLDPVLYSDAASYQCTATNHLGWKEERARTRDIMLTITGRPDVKPVNKTLMAIVGKPVTVTVLVCANPPPTRAYWILGRLLLSPGDTSYSQYLAQNYSGTDAPFCRLASLEIRSVHPDDSGEILFIAKNSMGIDDAVILLNVTYQAGFFIAEDASAAGRSSVGWSPLYHLFICWLLWNRLSHSGS